MKKFLTISIICVSIILSIASGVFASEATLVAELQTSFDTFSYYCSQRDSQSLYTIFMSNYLDEGEDSNVFILDIQDEIFSMVEQGGSLTIKVNSAALIDTNIAEANCSIYFFDGTDTKIESEEFIMKKDADNIWKLYGDQSNFEGMVFTEKTYDGKLYLNFKLDFNDEKKIEINGTEYDSSAIEAAAVEGIGHLQMRQDGDWPSCDTQILISDYPVSGTKYVFQLKLDGDVTIYTATAKFKKGLSNPLTITTPIANSVGDTTGHFEWTCGDQNLLIQRVNLSIWADGAQFNYWTDFEKEDANPLISKNIQLNYTQRTGHIINISVQDDDDNKSSARVYFYPLPGDGVFYGNFIFNTLPVNVESLNGLKVFVLLKANKDGQSVICDSTSFTLSFVGESSTNIFNYSFQNLYNNYYEMETFVDLNNNNKYDTGEPINHSGNNQITNENKNVEWNLVQYFSKNTPPVIQNFSINNFNSYTSSRDVNLHFSAYNTGDTCLMDTMYYRMITATETSGWFVYNTPDTIWTLSQTDGLKTLTLQVKDWFGNIAQSSAMITLDMTAPTVNEFVLNNGINVTTETQIILTFSVSDNLSGVYDTMVISGSVASSFETNLISPKTVLFANENGVKTLSAVFRDNAGNSVTVSDSILLDNSGPSFVFTPVTWADTTQSVNFQFYVTDYNYVKYVKLFYIDIDSSAQLSNLTEISANGNDSNVLSGTLTIPNRTSNALDSGYIYYYLESSDSINNKSYYVLSGESKSAPDNLTKLLKVQRIDFSAPSISINQGAYTNNVNCSVIINAVSVSGIALTGGKIYGDIVNTVSITDTAITNYGITLTGANGLKTIYCVYVDAMGNTSPAGAATIFFDNVNPVVALSIGSADVTNETAQLIALTYSDSTPCRDTYEVESSSDITYGAGDTMIAYPTTVILTSGDGIKTVTVKMYDSAGNMAEASDTIILDQTGPVFAFSPVTWADTTESIEIVFTATDNYSNIIGAKLFYIEMDSAANVSNKVELLKQGVDGKILNETFIIPARTSSAADSGSVYYYIGCADSWYNVRYYGASGQTITEPASISDFIKLLRQDITPLSVNELNYADVFTKTVISRNVAFSGTFGVSDKTNTLTVYNSETGETANISVNSETITTFAHNMNFTSDGLKTVIFTATSLNNEPPKNTVIKTFNIDVTPPDLKIISPSDSLTVNSDSIIVKGKLNHRTGHDIVKISLNNGAEISGNLENDTRNFNCQINGLTEGSNLLKITATDFVGNTVSIKLTVVYNADTTIIIKNVEIDSAAPEIEIDSSIIISNFLLKNGDFAPDTVELNISTSNNAQIKLNINIPDTSLPVSVTIKTAGDTSVRDLIETQTGEESVKKFGTDADYQAGLLTVRKFDFVRNGSESINDSVSASIIFTLPLQLINKYVGVYRFNENSLEWEALSEAQISSRDSGSITANVTHFSIYGVFSAGAPVQNNLNNIAIFPNPFKPNDGDNSTGTEFTGNLDAGNMTGIHIIGLPANAKIKIYTILGQLVDECQVLPNQGMAIWDARNKDGEKVASGVYMVLIDSPIGKKVKKLAIIR